MLILDRKIDQTIVIGGNITVSVLGVNREWVKLGFKAPDDVDILREELVGTEGKPHTHKKTEGMLILTRKVGGEGVVIGQSTFVKILGGTRNRVKVGIEAPFDVSIKRGEVLDEGRPHRSKEAL